MGGPIALADISERQGISLSYLEQLFAKLRKTGLVASTRGPGGGYTLGRTAAAIAVSDVIAAVDENVDATRCGGLKNCQHDLPCLTHDLWEDLNRQIRNFLSGVSLGDLINRNVTREIANRQDIFVLQRRSNALNS
jgi:Rrf2 family iron-sulfur cluster assembly transcriptional regulator